MTGKKDEFIYNKLINCKNESEEYIRNKRLELLHDDKERGPKKERPYKNWREIQVEQEYTGPRLEEKEEVTAEWYCCLYAGSSSSWSTSRTRNLYTSDMHYS